MREKREQLMEEFRKTGDVILASSEALDEAMADGRRVLAFAEAFDGPEALRSAAVAGQRQLTITTRASTVMGVHTVEILAKPVGRPRTGRGYSMAGSTPRIDDVADRFEAVVEQFLDFARQELRLRRPVDEIRTTTRRVNALETVVIPRLQRESAIIRAVLDERERQDRFRLKQAAKIRRSRRDPSAVH